MNQLKIEWDLTGFETREAAAAAAKEMLLSNGYTIIQDKHKTYFTYSKNDKFAYFQVDGYGLEGAGLSSSCKANKYTGTGFQYKKGYRFTLEDFEKALNYYWGEVRPKWFTSIQDYLMDSYSVFDSTVYTGTEAKQSLNYLENHFIFISTGHAPVINKVHDYLYKNFFEKREEKKAIFIVKSGEVEVLNHNIDLFNNYDIFNGFKKRLKGLK